jgi:UDP-N-acetylmuramoyl-L-alanyl-D-glutamate--2,6-diaminopimelate ligase
MSSFGAPSVGTSLRELLPGAQIYGAADIQVTSCTSDSRHCRPGDLFVALEGWEQDGHAYVDQAIERGAAAILAERYLPVTGLPHCVVEDTRQAYGELCQHLAGNPGRQLRMIGVTGTNGKTTCTYLIASVLEAAGWLSGVMGTLGSFDGIDVEPAELTTPTPPALANWMARMTANGCQYGVMEVTSHALAMKRVAGIEFDTACVTNIRHDHLDFHTTWERYREAKARLLAQVLPEGICIFNADDEGSRSLCERVDGPQLSVGVEQDAEITAMPVEQFLSEQTFLLSAGDETVPVRTPLIGRHNIENCLMAAAVGLAHGADLATVVRGLEAVRTIPGRFERIECGQPFGVFVDYAHTPDALDRVLTTLRPLTRGRLICVFGAGGDRDRSKRPFMGRTVSRLADVTVVTSDNPRGEDPQEIIDEIAVGLSSRRDARIIADRCEAIAWALGQARVGDSVVIAGRGHEAFQIFGSQMLPLDDREVARQWLYDHPYAPAAFRLSA